MAACTAALLKPVLLSAQTAVPPAPAGLTAPSATKSAVQLAWKGSGGPFVVERKASAGAFASVGRVAETTFTDTAVDQFATYVYRVRAVREVDSPAKPGGKETILSAPSNEITVGPPPVGFSQAVAAAAGKEGDFASHLSTAFDDNGDPAIAYNVLRAEGLKAHLYFAAWDRARYRWKAPVRVAVPGEIDSHSDNLGVSIARDTSDGTFVIAFQTGEGDGRGISLATSKDGVNWVTEVIRPVSDEQQSQTPSVAVADGVVHLVYLHVNNGIRYGSRKGRAGAFTTQLAPVPAGHEISRANTGVVLDGQRRAAVFYWYNARESARSVVAFWRPGQAEAAEAAVSESGSDDGFASLAFAGTAPRLLVNVRRDDDFEDHLWFTGSANGSAWSPLVKMPKDVRDYWNFPLSLAADSKGRLAATVTIVSGAGAELGRPKLLRSDDSKTWRVWSPDANRVLMGVPTVGQVMFAANDKLYTVFINNDPGRKMPAGINLWREP